MTLFQKTSLALATVSLLVALVVLAMAAARRYRLTGNGMLRRVGNHSLLMAAVTLAASALLGWGVCLGARTDWMHADPTARARTGIMLAADVLTMFAGLATLRYNSLATRDLENEGHGR